MTDFFDIVDDDYHGMTINPFAGKNVEGEWISGFTSIEFLNDHFGKFKTATEMKRATNSEELRMFFNWLVEQNKIPK